MSRLRSAMMVAVAVVLACASVVAAMPPVPYFSQCDSRWSNDGIYMGYSGGVVSAEDVSEDFTVSVADAKIQARFAEDKIQSLSSQTEIFVGQGFDKCEIPTLSQMQNWITNSPYGVVNLYIGGSCRSCSNSALTASYVSQLSQQGWKFIPTWVGPQSACWGGSCGSISNDPATAYNQGISEANAAIDVAIDLGLALADGSGAIIYYDLENYDTTNIACRNAAKSFISGWTAQLHARGSEAGVYGSSCGSAISDFATISNIPDAVWAAHWLTPYQYRPDATVWDVACLSNGIWGNHQRIRQYAGGHDETWGGVTLNIDCNVIDGIVASVASVGTADSIPLSGNLSGTGDINGTFNSSTAEFAFNGKTINFGTSTDLPVIGDWDGDGKDEIGIYRPDTGSSQSEFHLITRDWASLSNPVGAADKVIPFGYYPANIPITGDWDGDGDDDIGGFNPGNNKFYLYILNLGTSSAISYKDVPFGVSGDKPIIGDWDGDGDSDVGVYREYDPDYSNNLVFYFDLDLGGDQADLTPAPFGNNGDVAVIGDWDNDGDDDVGLYRAGAFIIDPDLNVPHDLAYLDNGIVKVGVDLEWGGAISVLMHQGMNLIDNHDTGRLAQAAFYNDDSGTWDPVQGGDAFNQGSPVLDYNVESNLIYTKTHPRDWKTGVLTDTHVEQWVSLEGESVKVRYKFTHFGTDTYTFHDQEFPCAYINSRLYRLITYTDGAPWTDGGISEFEIPQTDPGTPNTEFYPTEYWASFVDDSDFGLTLYSPDHTPKWAAHRFTIDTKPSYLATIDQFTIDPGTVEEATEYFIVGNYSDARSIVYSMGLNQLPTAVIDSITPDPAEQGTDTVSFTGHGTDSDGSIVAYNWRSSIDGQLSTSGSFSKPASDLSDGVHTIYYKVRDDNHSWSTEDTETLAIHLSGTDVITVDDDGPADYDNIQDAVDAAGMGDIIYVYNGTYNEHVTVSESLTLLGQNESDVIIDGGGSGDCVQISSSDVVINGFTITNASRYGIYASSSDLSIEHVTITGNSNYGIYFNSGKGFTLRDSTIDKNGGGIYYDGNAAGDAVVEDNVITNNVGFGVLIHLAEGKSATVRNNKIDNNAGSSSDGIHVHIAGSGGVMDIENNPVTKSGRRGIYLTGVRTGSTIANFTVHGSGSDGLRADYSDVNIENVTIAGNGAKGIYFVHGKGFTIRDSTIDGNAGGIIYYDAASGDAVVEDNVITNNVGSGVHIGLAEGKSATVRNNRIDNNAGSSSDGIYVNIGGSGGLMTIENNPVTNSGHYGIYLTGVRTGSTIANFTVQGSGSDGLRADYSDMNIENVTIINNGIKGIYFVHGKSFTIRNCTIDGNGEGIIYYDNAAGDAIVEDNIITNNVGSGVHIGLIEGKSATIKNNKIDNNAGSSSDGIYVNIAGSGGVTTVKNNLVGNSGRYGIYLTGVTNSTVIENTISINCYGMRLYSSSNNSIFHNNFIDNINYNAQDNRDSNLWDDGYPSGGNYWGDDYPGTDGDGDGIGDEPYGISGGAGAQDRYPLMQPWNTTPPPDPIPAIDSDGDGVPDAWDDEPDTPAGYWTDSHGRGRMWGDMNGDGKLTSVDALMILQAAAGGIAL